MIKKSKLLLFNFVRIRGLLFFALFIILPFFFSIIISYFKKVLPQFKLKIFIKIINYELLPILIFVFVFFLIIMLLQLKRKLYFSFFDEKINWTKSFTQALLPTILYFSLAFFITYIFFLISQLFPDTNIIRRWMSTPNQGYIEIFDSLQQGNTFKIIFWFSYIIVLAPIIEEIIFRGFLQESMQRILKNSSIVIVLNATIFSLFHLQSLSNVIFTFIVGFGLSVIRSKTKKINTSIIMHGIINFTGLLYGLIMQYLIKNNSLL